MVTFSPQFDTHTLDLELKKGESAQFAVAISDYDLDLRGCLVFTEIRRSSPGYTQIAGFTGSVSTSGNTITINQYPKTLDKAQLLSQLPVRQGDLITLEGSGISGSKVVAVTDSQIIATGTATRTINEGRLLVRSLSLASFTAIPYSPVITVTATGTAVVGQETINVSGVSRDLASGSILIFNDSGTPKIARLTRLAVANDTIIYVSPLEVEITAASTADIGATTVITTAGAALEATSISIDSLGVPIPANSLLSFATRTADGWVYVGSAALTSSVLAGVTSLPVSALTTAIPEDAIAWFGTLPFNSFYLAIDPTDTQFLESGDYGYDVVVRQSNNFTLRVMQGNIKLTDHWSDGV
ncbi:hypothetical protein [Anabaena catenula]|uniref:Uncharacterized protein n=1 Tax=Anabaena catenula FACHB-362 TaxID=2692877 RepID=A0ABR8J7U3_9NOST|nr:hypothetical protein [Anabaena catenula]MBD2694442.1 hypothetical protein [Anabaena catenula FACHB-362]